jgi:hypothetical protein
MNMRESEIKVREMSDMNNLILYTTEDGKSQIKLRADLGTVWLTQLEMAELLTPPSRTFHCISRICSWTRS